MAIREFVGTLHLFTLKGKDRSVVDPRTIPSDIRDALCVQGNYWLPSKLGKNHDVAHFDLERNSWRDMRNAFQWGSAIRTFQYDTEKNMIFLAPTK